MKKLHSVKMLAMLTAFAVGPVQANYNNNCEGPLEADRWYVMPKIGAAPGIFANRGYEQRVQPLGGTNNADRTIGCIPFGDSSLPVLNGTNQFNALQQNACKNPRLDEIFSNGILHVGVEVGRNVCDNIQMYLEFVYNRASGRSLTQVTTNYASPEGCASNDCSSTSTGNILSTSTRTSVFNDYTAYGLFIGARHYCGWRPFCDKIDLWAGFKAGFLHRNAIDACISVPAETATVATVGDYTFAARENINDTIFCKSFTVAAGGSLGFDYCFNDRFTLFVGVEVVASSALKTNSNIQLPLGTVTPVAPNTTVIPTGAFPQPTNVLIGNTGTFIQFPVWAGFSYEFDFCKRTC